MSEQWKNDEAGDDLQMPLGTGGDPGVDGGESYSGESKPKVNSSTLALVFSFMAALAVLYLLGLHNKPRAASAEQLSHESQVKSAITDMLQKNGKAVQIQGLIKDTDKLVDMIYHYLGSQSNSSDVPANPFASDNYTPAPSFNSEAADIVANNAAEAENLRRVAETFNGLKLQSVMVAGKNSVAMINNRMLSLGGKVGDLTVTTIEPTRVIMSYGKNNFELKLNKDNP